MLNPIMAPFHQHHAVFWWTCMHPCGAGHRTTYCRHPPYHHPDIPSPASSPMDLSESRINAQADVRVHQIFEDPAPPAAPTEEPDLPDAEDDESDQYDPGMDLLQVIDQPVTKDAPSPFQLASYSPLVQPHLRP